MFNHLGINELERVNSAEIVRTETLLEKQYFKSFSHSPLLPITLVLKEGGRVDARQLRSETEKFVKTELFKFCNLYAKEKLDDALGGIDHIHFDIDEDEVKKATDVHVLYESPEKPKILLIANLEFTGLCQKQVQGIQLFSASSPDEAIDVLLTEDIDMVLLDIWTKRNMDQDQNPDDKISLTMSVEKKGEDHGQDYVPLSARTLDEGRNILRRIHERSPETPIYLLSFTNMKKSRVKEIPEEALSLSSTVSIDAVSDNREDQGIGKSSYRTINDELFLACVRAGGARGLVATNFFSDSGFDWEKRRDQFSASLTEINQRLYREKKALSLTQERKVLVFDTSTQVKKKERKLIVQLRDFHMRRVIDAVDASEVLDEVIRPSIRFNDVIGADEAKKSLQFIVDWVQNPKRYRSMGIRPPKGILMLGPPGTGKTMLARAVAGESNCAFLAKGADSFVTIWQGSGPQNVRNLFESARRYAPAIVFIDEIDTIGKKRTGGAGGNRSQEDALNALLVEMDGFSAPTSQPIIVLAATNVDKQMLDDALLRRFDRDVTVGKPDKAARKKYIKKALSNRKKQEITLPVLERIAKQSVGMTIADLERILHEATVMAAQKDTILTDAILEEAFEKIRMGVAKRTPDRKVLERTAYHESGHTLIAWMGGNPPLQVTIVGRGNAGGYMEREIDEKARSYTKPEIEQLIREALAGRAAEILYYGEEEGLSTGISNDLRVSTQYALRMVREYGMVEDFALAAISEKMQDGPISEKITKAAERIVKEQQKNAIQILKENKKYLDRLSDRLLEKNRLATEDLEEILSGLKKGK
jgi:ATP-dependent metalloprotease FtsH